MNLNPGILIYEGKAKKIFTIPSRPDWVWIEYKDSLTAFNAQKKGSFQGKGALNRDITSLIFQYLQTQGLPHHWKENVGTNVMICQKVTIIPLEIVVRNLLAGSTAKKFALPEGRPLAQPLVEFYYKSDELEDPFISDDQALMLQIVENKNDLEDFKSLALKVNHHLKFFFKEVGLELVDFKIELGRCPNNKILLADEISPDSCRLWDLQTGERLDKDRFRRDWGRVEESYQEVWQRLNQRWTKELVT